ncbi:MAG: signal recognition particle protein [Bacteroidetes bacterium]|nr:signal recognition particle protein [Bacteroidota bacterium]MBU1423186.1 signal recognition particle protein [Bacteroidota bacterium]MBU2635626.1 signal recognition particle protein [Bacteroidota bacterium]
MFDNLTEKLESVFKKLRGYGKITESNIFDSMREVRRALLDADVNYKVVKQFVEDVQKRAMGQEVIESLNPGQLIIKIIHDELIKLLGESRQDIKFSTLPPTVIMVAGLQGSGKTTFCAKLANHLKSKGRYPMLTAADIYRPAAVDQLVMLGKQIDVLVHFEHGKNAVELAVDSVEHARKAARDVVIIDTAGRLHIDEEMMREVESIKSRVNPNEILFVVDAMTGQDAVNTAKAFHDRLNYDGVVLTKLDGDTRGGAAFSIRAVVTKPIKFVGVGEKLDALEPFHPDRMASRILGMGDMVTLVEKAQQQFDEQKVEKLEEKLRKSQFTLEDFLEQLQQVKKMGPLSQVLSMIPGLNKLPVNTDVNDKSLVRVEAIIQSMTQKERINPNIINGNRRKRIAIGSGTSVQEVNKVLKQFFEMQKMMKAFSKGKIPKHLRGLKLPTG